MLYTYADETGDSQDPTKKFVGIAGFLGLSDKWIEFDKEWRRVCAEENVSLPFHMTDFASSTEQFKSWKGDKPRRDRLLGGLVGAINNAAVSPFGAIVPIEDFNSLTDEQRSRLGGDPYYVAFQEITHQLAFRVATSVWPPDPVTMVYARKRKYTEKAVSCWEAIKEANLYGLCMSSILIGDPKDYTPLQAADVYAYEIGRHFEYIVPNDKECRWAFQEIVDHAFWKKGGHIGFKYCDRKFMLEILGESVGPAS
jgi:hypothetical protein